MLTLNQLDPDTDVVSKGLIMVVEDDLNLLEGIQTVLELEHYEVISVENGKQALETLRAHTRQPDLIVSDIMMPHMNGLELLREVRKERAWIRIPFIFLTALSERPDIHRGKMLGVDDYLTKPFDAEDLIVAVDSRLRRHHALNELHRTAMRDLKRTILTILNHEFRTPLTFVVAYSDMLNDTGNYPANGDDMMLFLRGVSAGAARLRRLIENFIHLVEMETGDAEQMYMVRRAPIVNIYELLNGSVEAAKQTADYPPNIVLCVNEELPPFIADAAYLQMALVHLLDNAIKFSPPGAPINIGARTFEGYLVLSVEDHGRGIDPLYHKDIWEVFYQHEREIYENQGAGAGLAIVQGIAQLHGGRAAVESEPGKGSVFSIYIPIIV
jgi:two-component system sensor histidine kinase/response regulator